MCSHDSSSEDGNRRSVQSCHEEDDTDVDRGRRRSEEDNGRRLIAVSKNRQSKHPGNRLSTSGGFLPLSHSSNSNSQFSTSPDHQESSHDESEQGGNWWRSAPDLSAQTISPAQKGPRKRNSAGRFKQRPSIDLFKYVSC